MNVSRGRSRCLSTVLVVAALAGCKSIDGTTPTLIPNKAVTISIPLDTLDPLAPNWHIEQQALGAGRYAFALKKKRFTTGGDGEARPVLDRRITQLAREHGYQGHVLLDYTEGIHSDVPIAQRVAQAVVQFTGPPLVGTAPEAK
jgi:hypothetical protein